MNPVSSASGSVPQILNAQVPALAPWLEAREASADRRLDRGRFWRRWRGAPGPEVVQATLPKEEKK